MPPVQQETLNRAGAFVVVAIVLMLAYVSWALVNLEIPKANENILFAIIGVLATQLTSIVQFFYGSSWGAKKQAETVDTLVQTAHAVQAATSPAPPTVRLDPGETATVEANRETT